MSFVKQKLSAMAAGKPILIILVSDCSRSQITKPANSYEHLKPDNTKANKYLAECSFIHRNCRILFNSWTDIFRN